MFCTHQLFPCLSVHSFSFLRHGIISTDAFFAGTAYGLICEIFSFAASSVITINSHSLEFPALGDAVAYFRIRMIFSLVTTFFLNFRTEMRFDKIDFFSSFSKNASTFGERSVTLYVTISECPGFKT